MAGEDLPVETSAMEGVGQMAVSLADTEPGSRLGCVGWHSGPAEVAARRRTGDEKRSLGHAAWLDCPVAAAADLEHNSHQLVDLYFDNHAEAVHSCPIGLPEGTFDDVDDFERTWNLEPPALAEDGRPVCRERYGTAWMRAGLVGSPGLSYSSS